MNRALDAPDVAVLSARLTDAVSPEEVVEASFAWLEETGLGRPLGLYFDDTDGQLVLEPRFAPAPSAPSVLDPTADVDSDAASTRVIPFSFRGRPLGAVLTSKAADAREVASRFEEDIAPALFRALVLDDALNDKERMREQLFYLDEMGKLLGRLDLDLLLVNVLELTSAHLGADIGSITLTGPDGLVTAVDWGLPHDVLVSLRRPDGSSVLDEALLSGEPILLAADELVTDDRARYNFERLLLLPLRTNDAVWGSINLVTPARVTDLASPLLDSIRSGVGLAATAVENALLIEMKLSREREQEQLKVGHQIQSALLPTEAPERSGLEMDGASVSATMIGGDYFDYFELPDGRLGLVVADVSGKGVPAGLIMTATRALFRATSSSQSEPAGILDEVNRLLCAEGFGSRFVTAVFAAIDSESGAVDFSTAGHDAPTVWCARTGEVHSSPVPALPLGLRSAVTYEQQTVELDEGDVMVLYTDGVSESMNAEREQFGEARLQAVLVENAGLDAATLRERIQHRIEAHCGSIPQHDDTTLIVVRRIAPAS